MSIYNRPFGSTIRDFSKSQSGREFLDRHFDFSGFPAPEFPEPIAFDSPLDSGVLGTAFDQLLLLMVERQNPDVPGWKNTWQRLPNRRNADARMIKAYLEKGSTGNGLLDYFIRNSQRKQSSFTRTSARGRPASSSALRSALHGLHDVAVAMSWSVHRHLGRGFLVYSTALAASADLVMDETLVEIKVVKDAAHHSEHVAQLLAYYLTAQAPVHKPHHLAIETLAIYYARQGILAKAPLLTLARFDKPQLARIAFDFLAEFEFWRDFRDATGLPARQLQSFRDYSFNRTLLSIHPRPTWLADALQERPNQAIGHWRSLVGKRVKRIPVPPNFLLPQSGA